MGKKRKIVQKEPEPEISSSSDSEVEGDVEFASFLSSRPGSGDAKEEFLRKYVNFFQSSLILFE